MKEDRCKIKNLSDDPRLYIQARGLREVGIPSTNGKQDSDADRYAFLEELSDDLGAYVRPEWVLENNERKAAYTTEEQINMRFSQFLGKLSEEFGVKIIDPWVREEWEEYRKNPGNTNIKEVRILIRYPEK